MSASETITPLILIVDDSDDFRAYVTRMLNVEGWRTQAVATGSEGLAAIRGEVPHCVLLDMVLPDQRGEQVLAEIRKEYSLGSLPVILMSAVIDDNAGLLLLQGANDFFEKPFNMPVVIARIRTQLWLRSTINRLANANRHLQQFDEVRSRFLSAVSHELRTPLTAIVTAVGLLSDGSMGDVTRDQQQCLDMVRRNGERLRRMIEQWLEAAAHGAQVARFLLRPVSVERVVRDAEAVLFLRAGETGGTVCVDLPSEELVVNADPDGLVQVLINMGYNALQHNPPGTIVTLRCAVYDGEVRMSVADNGVGIKRQDLDMIFEWFTSFDDAGRARGTGGYGIGLAITQEILRAHGAVIAVESEPGQGTEFSFCLPLCECASVNSRSEGCV